jgi:hypothetical protein
VAAVVRYGDSLLAKNWRPFRREGEPLTRNLALFLPGLAGSERNLRVISQLIMETY